MMIKLIFIPGLKEIVLNEIKKYSDLQILNETNEEIYFKGDIDFKILKNLKSVLKVCIVEIDERYNPIYISKHKSILGNMIEKVLKESEDKFKTFKINCAGSDSKEIQQIKDYIIDTYKLKESEDADLKIYIIKPTESWEIAIQITSKPLSFRNYKVENIKGGMNSTIAYAMNTFADLDNISSYLNIFSGSATLLIEAGLINPNIKLIGFDKDGKTNALAIKNIKKAELIKSIQLKTADIFNDPDIGKFDIIVSDLPFGMLISKGENLEGLYKQFVKYTKNSLNPEGKLIVYTSEHEVLRKILIRSGFDILKELSLRILSGSNTYMYTKIFICK